MPASSLPLVSRRYKALILLVAVVGVLALVYARYSLSSKSPLALVWLSKNVEKDYQLPLDRFKAWQQGVVTLLQPPVQKNCSKLLAGDRSETERIKAAVSGWKTQMHSIISHDTANCSWLVEYFTNNLYNSKLEKKFPIAFSFVVYEGPEQFLRLLKLLYRPQNAYCIHYDSKSFYKPFFKNIANCFPNVIVPSEIVNVTWGEKTLLMAQKSCLTDLVSYRERQREEERWRYVMNLCGKELPLTTTRMMVEKLISMNGTSSVVSWPIPNSETWTISRLRGQTLPHKLTLYKSMTYNALSSQFVYFLLQNSIAIETYNFFMKTWFPEEHFYATLFRMPGVPGGYDPHIPDEQYFEVGHYFWRTNKEELLQPCYGIAVHQICVVNYADLPRVMKETKNGTSAFFQNKYFMEHDRVVMDCMEERIVAINKREFELEYWNS